jgi:serine/threonine protein phosphatase 1
MPSRLIAVGDVHGCSRALRTLIDLIEPAEDDTIVTLGDYVDRGPDSRGVIDRLITLSRQFRLVPLLGNHDQMFLEARPGGSYSRDREPERHDLWLGYGGDATLASYGDSGDLSQVPLDHFAFLESCRTWYESPTHLFAHANYLAEAPMDEQPEWILLWESLRERVPTRHVSKKTFILGHTSQKTGSVLDLGHLICIDTYCHGGGYLTAFEVNSRRIWQVDRQGMPRRSTENGRSR